MTTLPGRLVTLRSVAPDDVAALAEIRLKPEVRDRWRGADDMVAEVESDIAEPDVRTFVIEYEGGIVGAIQWGAEEEPDYRHASIDIYVDPSVHGRGVGPDAVRTLSRHIVGHHGHHRITIDPAADNAAAIRAYAKVGFKPVGIMRQYERGADGMWHDGLLMDLLADEIIDGP